MTSSPDDLKREDALRLVATRENMGGTIHWHVDLCTMFRLLDEARAECDRIKQVEFPARIEKVSAAWRAKIEALTTAQSKWREIAHAAWHALDDSEDRGVDGVSVTRQDADALHAALTALDGEGDIHTSLALDGERKRAQEAVSQCEELRRQLTIERVKRVALEQPLISAAADADAAESRCEALTTALHTFGQHTDECNCRADPERETPCDCGLDAAIAASGAEPTGMQATRDVIAERQRQVSVEGWTPDHDDEHGNGQMARAAAAYCIHHSAKLYPEPAEDAPSDRHWMFQHAAAVWPWGKKWWKPKDARRDLVRAGALILAEIERIDRLDSARSKTPAPSDGSGT